jgi:hypothetical protein
MQELIVKYLIISSAGAGVIVFIGKSIIKAVFDASLKKYQSSIDLIRVEHEIRFAKLHEARANFIKDLYNKLHDLQKDLIHLTSLSQGPEWSMDKSRSEKARETHNDLVEMFEKNRFYFEESFNNEFEGTLNLSLDVLLKMDVAKLSARRRGNKEDDGKYHVDIWMEQQEKANLEMKTKRLELANYIREVLGVKIERSTTPPNTP